MTAALAGRLGRPRLHLSRVDSTNLRARELARAGAPHGTVVTAGEQTAGRGRQGRAWRAPAGRALLCSTIVHDPPRLLPLRAGLAVAEVAGAQAMVKWPNDVLIEGRKVAGILVEGRPAERWAVIGIGLNVALDEEDFAPELRGRATGLGLTERDVEPILTRLLERLEVWLTAVDEAALEAIRARDALRDRPLRWTGGEGTGAGIDPEGRLVVMTADGPRALDAGEVHLLA